MKICTICGKRNANVYTQRAENGEVKLTLCRDCYSALYLQNQERDYIDAFFGGKDPRLNKECPVCGTTLAEYRATGLLGCAHCYTALREELLPSIRYIQGEEVHRGLAPSSEAEDRYDDVRALAFEQEKLRERIREAENAGQTYLVNRLREQLAALNRKLNGGDRT